MVVAAREGQGEAEQLEEHHATAEDVGLGVELAPPDLGGHGRWGADGPVEPEVSRAKDLRHPEVDDHRMGPLSHVCQSAALRGPARGQRAPAGHQHDVGRLQVEVEDAAGVHVRDGQQDLAHDLRDEELRQGSLRTLSLPDCSLQLTARAVVHDQVDALRVLEMLVELHDVGVVQEAEVLHLGVQLLRAAREVLALADELHRAPGARRPAARQLHQAVRALPQGLAQVVGLLDHLATAGRGGLRGQRLAEVSLHAPEELPEGLAEALGAQPSAVGLLDDMPQSTDGAADAQLRVQLSPRGVHALQAERSRTASATTGARAGGGVAAEDRLGLLLQTALAKCPSHPLKLSPARLRAGPQPGALLLEVQHLTRLHVDLHGACLCIHVQHGTGHPAVVRVTVVLGLAALHQLS
mmetsp:Transcript_77042/g.249299  ORF Transcript_77042/g.249299 Transcript_77042/m.249299 type:complete len:410 (+) Transcript_77042:1216-2445(+)